jgi:hypothetical protein
MPNRIKLIVHFLLLSFFGVAIIFQARSLASYYHESVLFNLLDATLCYGSFLGFIYVSYNFFIPRFLVEREYVKFFSVALLLIAAFTGFFNFSALFLAKIAGVKFHVFVKGWWFGIAGYAVVFLTIGSLLRMFFIWLEESQVKMEKEKQNIKSELAQLKNQLNPHFLFNSLNNIDSLIHEDSGKASVALNKLSDMMRYMVYDTERDFVLLSEELTYIQNYIDIQKLRVSEPGLIYFIILGDSGDKKVAPMLFIPFIENSFKHSSLKGKDGNKIRIRFEISKNSINFSCFNRKSLIQKDKAGGIGLENVKKRLDILYSNMYKLEVNNSDLEFLVNLELKLL